MKKILFTVLMLVAVCAFKCGGDDNGGNLPINYPAQLPYTYVTPFGVRIVSVVPIPEDKKAAVFSAIEIGIHKQIETTIQHNFSWRKARNLADYRVAFIEPDATNLDGSPALLYRGQIQTAGTVIGVAKDGFSPTTIVLPHQANQNWRYTDYLRDSARFESEHFAEWSNDESIFYRFATENDVHPHWKADGE